MIRLFLRSALVLLPLAASCNSTTLGGDVGDGGGNGDGGSLVDPNCTNLCLQQVKCSGGGSTTVSGVVTIPAGTLPLYGATVYVPNAPVGAITNGASCDRCDTLYSGSPLVTTTTDVKGHFSLTNVPVGANIPVVIQMGKWRRQITIPSVGMCTDNPLDGTMTSLPSKSSQGDMPKIALTTGAADVIECLFHKIGIDPSEITPETGTGHVNLYAGGSTTDNRGNPVPPTNKYAANMNGGASFTSAQTLWNSSTNLNKYDIVMLSCEGQQNAGIKGPTATANLQTYANLGGRVFMSHWHNYWLAFGPKGSAPNNLGFGDVASFVADGTADPTNMLTTSIDTTFPKGMAFSTWLQNNKALDGNGQLSISAARKTITGIKNNAAPNQISQQWIYYATGGNPATLPEYITFNTPIGPPSYAKMQCGRVVFTDLHVAGAQGTDANGQPATDSPSVNFPGGCVTTSLSPQEKALIFMFFDLSNCISTDIVIG